MMSKNPACRSMVTDSDPSMVTEVCGWILSKLESENFSQKDVFAVHLALEEAFLNAVNHGNKKDPSKKVKIDYAVTSDKVEITITDEGPGFKPENVPDPRQSDNLYKPQGRGLLLINSYMDSVKYNDKGNTVHMTKYKTQEPVEKK